MEMHTATMPLLYSMLYDTRGVEWSQAVTSPVALCNLKVIFYVQPLSLCYSSAESSVCVRETKGVAPGSRLDTNPPPSFFHSIPLLIGHFLFLSYILFGLTEKRTHTHGSLKGIHLAVCETHILSSKHINILCACRH